jgi:hypothetical protein
MCIYIKFRTDKVIQYDCAKRDGRREVFKIVETQKNQQQGTYTNLKPYENKSNPPPPKKKKLKIYSLNLRLLLNHILYSQDVLFFFKLFLIVGWSCENLSRPDLVAISLTG